VVAFHQKYQEVEIHQYPSRGWISHVYLQQTQPEKSEEKATKKWVGSLTHEDYIGHMPKSPLLTFSFIAGSMNGVIIFQSPQNM
jgi:hypothetical protein